MRCTVVATLFALFSGIVWAGDQPAVVVHGALKNIMHKGDLSAKADLAMFDGVSHIYALGALADLKGELIILDGRPYLSSVQAGSLLVVNTLEGQAALLVHAQVEAWKTFPVPEGITTYEELETWLPDLATGHGPDTSRAFPFMITGSPKQIDWHVIDWPEGDTVHTHDKHVNSGLSGTIEDGEVTIVGFYSSKHKAVFTHHTTKMHMHVINADHTIAGHVDGLVLKPGTQLLLPE